MLLTCSHVFLHFLSHPTTCVIVCHHPCRKHVLVSDVLLHVFTCWLRVFTHSASCCMTSCMLPYVVMCVAACCPMLPHVTRSRVLWCVFACCRILFACFHMFSHVFTCFHTFSCVFTCFHVLSQPPLPPCGHTCCCVLPRVLSHVTIYCAPRRPLTCSHTFLTCFHMSSLAPSRVVTHVIACHHMYSIYCDMQPFLMRSCVFLACLLCVSCMFCHPVTRVRRMLSHVVACCPMLPQGEAAAGAALRGEGDGRLLLRPAVTRRGERWPFKSHPIGTPGPHRDTIGNP